MCLVIVAYLDLERVPVNETETNAPLVVDGNGILPLPVVFERVQTIPWRDAKIVQARREVHVFQLAGGAHHNIRGKTLRRAKEKEFVLASVRERLDQGVR